MRAHIFYEKSLDAYVEPDTPRRNRGTSLKARGLPRRASQGTSSEDSHCIIVSSESEPSLCCPGSNAFLEKAESIMKRVFRLLQHYAGELIERLRQEARMGSKWVSQVR